MNKLMKPVFGILFILAFGYSSTIAQRRIHMPVKRGYPINRANKPNRKIEEVKEGFIGRQLKLTSEQSKAFWPLYRQYVQELTAIRILRRLNNSDASADGTVQIDKELAYETQIVDVKKHYRDEFLKVLPPEKVSELYKSEREFNDEMIKQLSDRSVRAGD
jgi:hypothetical protein